MHIFVDESGTFVLPTAANSVSLVAALVVPDRRLPYIEKLYSKIRTKLPQENGEVKGRLLNEKDIDLVVSMLAKQQVLFEAQAIDLSIHQVDDVAWHKALQAEGVTKNLTDGHAPSVRDAVFGWRAELEKLPYQLYIQSIVTFELIANLLELSTMFYSQRIPKELDKFHWVIDGKDRDKTTNWENWWSQVVKPFLQARWLRERFPEFEEGDYRYFSRFDGDIPHYLKPHIQNDNAAPLATNLGQIMSESFRFSSNPEFGLELVDILTNATRRALNGNLNEEGWRKIPHLMIHRGGHYIRMGVLMNREIPEVQYPYMAVLRGFSTGGRSMLSSKFDKR